MKRSKVIITSLQTNQPCPLDLTHQNLSSYHGIQVRVFLYEGFVTDEECDHLLSLVSDNLDKPLVTENITGNGSSAAVSSHNGFELARGLDEVILRIEQRISAWTFLPNENGEDMRISHYHANADSEQPYQFNHNSSENAISELRIATILIFLSNVSRGGEIVFPSSKVEASNTRKRREFSSECASSSTFVVKHVKGSALLIFNLHPNATADESSLHRECLVLEGEKWSATKRIRVRTFDRKKQSPDSYEECTDEDDNCRQWAAMGECRRNAVYMLGTPDYYGSCRKSCGVC
ncbi:hypothetical protein KSP39_PZI023652 [Platanthera zijinensis]|uniref:procollagen-proline 4-dioxygenase n=1 Tax=Platanthera zijinensis TaxID=2320716 RepID=A0AAP0ASK9_9ASPA